MEGYDAEIFVPSEFEEQTFTFGDLEQRLFCSKAATTDYDLTGLVVWPASQVLAWYVVQTRHLVEGKHVMEVGAGCGLTGFVAAKCQATRVSLTDGNSHVLDLLRKTQDSNEIASDVVRVSPLTWGDAESLQHLIRSFEEERSWPTVVLGADVFQTSFGSPSLLFATIKRIFQTAQQHGTNQEECAFYACFALRATTKEELVAQCAQEEGFAMQKLCIRDMLPKGIHPDDFTREKLRLIKYTLTL